uniref:Uncharacterized protein n=1 Tax=Trieres chinensis TaxID=1514140 RepID=A0A7S2A830_TRICV
MRLLPQAASTRIAHSTALDMILQDWAVLLERVRPLLVNLSLLPFLGPQLLCHQLSLYLGLLPLPLSPVPCHHWTPVLLFQGETQMDVASLMRLLPQAASTKTHSTALGIA